MQQLRHIDSVAHHISQRQRYHLVTKKQIDDLCKEIYALISSRFPILFSSNFNLSTFSKKLFLLEGKEFDRIYDTIARKEHWDKRFYGVYATYRIYAQEGICIIRSQPPELDTSSTLPFNVLRLYYLHAIGHEMIESLQNYYYTEDIVHEEIAFLIDEIRNFIVWQSLLPLLPSSYLYIPSFVHTNTFINIIDLSYLLGEESLIELIKYPHTDTLFLEKLKKKLSVRDFTHLVKSWKKDNMLSSHIILTNYISSQTH